MRTKYKRIIKLFNKVRIGLQLTMLISMIPQLHAASDVLGEKAPEFSLSDLDGKHVYKLSDYKDKIVILDFWASWCAPCKKSLPKLNQLAKSNDDKIVILTISVDDDISNARKFKKLLGIDLIALFDAAKKVATDYDVPAMPTLFIINQKGVVHAIFDGYTEDSWNDIVSELKKLR
jgi:thiol-disulfide isomerase/thioredoxin